MLSENQQMILFGHNTGKKNMPGVAADSCAGNGPDWGLIVRAIMDTLSARRPLMASLHLEEPQKPSDLTLEVPERRHLIFLPKSPWGVSFDPKAPLWTLTLLGK